MTEKGVFPTSTQTKLLEVWRRRARRAQTAHYSAANRADRRTLLIGLPIIILTTLSATTVFAGGVSDRPFALAAGLMSVIAAILAGIQTFLRFPERAEKHRIAGTRFGDIKRELELLIAVPSDNEQELKGKLKDIKEQWRKLNEESPTAPGLIWEGEVPAFAAPTEEVADRT